MVGGGKRGEEDLTLIEARRGRSESVDDELELGLGLGLGFFWGCIWELLYCTKGFLIQ